MNLAVLSATGAAFYAATLAFDARRARRGDNGADAIFILLLLCALAGHFAANLINIGASSGGWNLSLTSTLSITAWMIAAIAGVLRIRQQQGLLLMPLLAAAAVICLWAGLAPIDPRTTQAQLGLGLHVTLSLAAFALLFIAGGQALLLSWQNKALKSRDLSAVLGLPPLISMERLLFDLITGGWVLLTAALLTGMLFVESFFAQHLIHKTVLSLFAWVMFGSLLAGRWLAGWRAQTASTLTITGLGILIVGTMGSKIILEVVLDRL